MFASCMTEAACSFGWSWERGNFFFPEYVLYSERWKELYVICWLILESSSRGPVCDVLCELALELLLPWDVASWTSAGNTDVHLLVCCRV